MKYLFSHEIKGLIAVALYLLYTWVAKRVGRKKVLQRIEVKIKMYNSPNLERLQERRDRTSKNYQILVLLFTELFFMISFVSLANQSYFLNPDIDFPQLLAKPSWFFKGGAGLGLFNRKSSDSGLWDAIESEVEAIERKHPIYTDFQANK